MTEALPFGAPGPPAECGNDDNDDDNDNDNSGMDKATRSDSYPSSIRLSSTQ